MLDVGRLLELHPGALLLSRGTGEACVVGFDKRWQELVGLRERTDTCETQLFAQSILKRPPQSLDAPLRLWRERQDRLDAQVCRHPLHL